MQKNDNWQDWNEVSWNKTNERKKNETKEQQILRLKRVDPSKVETIKKNSCNKQTTDSVVPMKNIDGDIDSYVHKKVSMTMAKRIAQKRCEIKLSQKDLAFKLSLPVKIIQDYESSKAIPNHLIINKLQQILGPLRD
jgi:ribosome-binding protein aMBF1 (putative translation factor)